MGKRVRRCCVPLCTSTSEEKSHYKFPNPKNSILYRAWLMSVGNRDLLQKDPAVVHTAYFVCTSHFKPCDILTSRLATGAIPSLLLPDPIDVPFPASIDYAEANIIPNEAEPMNELMVPTTSAPDNEVSGSEAREVFAELSIGGNVVDTTDKLVLPRKLEPDYAVPSSSGMALIDDYVEASCSNQNVTQNTIAEPKADVHTRAKLVGLKRKLYYYQRKSLSLHDTVKVLRKNVADMSTLPPTVMRFLQSQLLNTKKLRKGRRFGLKDKCLALSLYKCSPRSYRLLEQIFALPSIQTVRKLLNRIPVKPGVLHSVFRCLEQTVSKMPLRDRLCTLMFDEMSLQAHVKYNEATDIVEGLVDNGKERKAEMADHVQVYMLRGIYRKWKQPVAFTFCKSTTSADVIFCHFKEIVRTASKIGLKIIASVCDQGATNCKAIAMLREETRRNALRNDVEPRDDAIIIDDNKIVPLFDPPHLLKCMRNNLLTKDLIFWQDGKKKTAKWSHIVDAYKVDKSGRSSIMTKLTEFHVIPRKVKKMKVSCCTQVFSKTVSAAMDIMARSRTPSVDGCIVMCTESQDTSDLCLFLDKLFDSVNGGRNFLDWKVLRRPVTELSQHEAMWNEGIKILKTMAFIPKKPTDRAKPVVLKNFMSTLEGFKLIKRELKTLGCGDFPARSFNQDPLENFFCQIRQQGVRNTNPTCTQFVPYLKSLLVNNFLKQHSRGANCQNDESIGLMTAVERFVNQEVNVEGEIMPCSITPTLLASFQPYTSLEKITISYVSGWLANKILPTIKNCDTCKANVLYTDPEPLEIHSFIVAKEPDLSKNHLKYCNMNFINSLLQLYDMCHSMFPLLIQSKNIIYHISNILSSNYNFPFQNCPHSQALKSKILKSYTKLLLHYYNDRLNQIIFKKLTNIPNPDSFQKSVIQSLPRF